MCVVLRFYIKIFYCKILLYRIICVCISDSLNVVVRKVINKMLSLS